MHRRLDLFRGTALGAIAEHTGLSAVDIGARGGAEPELLPLAWAMSVWGFEPDPDACRQLKRESSSQPWKSVEYVPCAIGGRDEERELFVTRAPEGTSLIRHNQAVCEQFAYPALSDIVKVVRVKTLGLDEARRRYSIEAPALLKLDVEGAELEILSAAEKTLHTVQALKVEVAYVEQRIGQPLGGEVQSFLESRGFLCMDIYNVHRWRKYTTIGHPYSVRFSIPYSKGQLAQADLFFLRSPATAIEACNRGHCDQAVRLALLAACWGYFDFAWSVLSHPAVRSFLEGSCGVDPGQAIREASTRYGRSVARETIYRAMRDLIPLTRSWARTLRVRRAALP